MSSISESHQKLTCHHSFGQPISFYSRKEIPRWSAGLVRSPCCPPEPRALGKLYGGVTEHLITFDQSHTWCRKLENSAKGKTGFPSHVIHNWRSSVHTIRTVNCQCQQDLEVQGKHFQAWSSAPVALCPYKHYYSRLLPATEGWLRKNEKRTPKHKRPGGTSLEESPAFQV